ncbi:PDZ domain-containing protein [Streptomyces sp. YC537]|uniref:PDZ domain-containing protein n=2 Tax=Streptomyces boluensis TaxID=1775135 RepID=A0A964UKL8_9ACTN|nr:PDZ domain-containing protein [Streptomyces boluensis]NBE50839.1 PDZ domain-containing protein [Streptomyces boluensis]
MEQTALRPKPMPGRAAAAEPGHRPHAARRRGRRLMTALLTVGAALTLLLAGVGLGTVGATVIGMSRLADLKQQAAAHLPGQQGGAQPSGPRTGGPDHSGQPSHQEPQGGTADAKGAGASGRAARPTLGVEAVDAPKGGGALLVGVHVPGPGYVAGLVRGDVLLTLGGAKVGSAAQLAAAVAQSRPGAAVPVTVRHANGERQYLSVTPGVVT